MRYAYLFPGQGAQTVGMGKDFYESYSESKQIFEWAEVLLNRSLKEIIFEGPQDLLTETRNSQPCIFIASMATLAAIKKELPQLVPTYAAGLSLGEYTALCAAGVLSFEEILPLVQYRADVMNAACEVTQGGMAALIGLSKEQVEAVVKEVALPNDLWVANYNCPGQYVISGTKLGIEKGTIAAKEAGARKVVPLDVHGAFHSGLMESAQTLLGPKIEDASFKESSVKIVMNRPGLVVTDPAQMKQELTKQVTASVRWEQSIEAIKDDVDLFIEIGCGKSLAGMNRKIGCSAPTISVSKVEDIAKLKEWIKEHES